MTDDDFPSRWLSIRGARERVGYELQKIADDDFLTRWPHIRDNNKKKGTKKSGLLYASVLDFLLNIPSRHAYVCVRNHRRKSFAPVSLGMTEVESASCRSPRECDCGKKNTQREFHRHFPRANRRSDLCILRINIYTKIYLSIFVQINFFIAWRHILNY